MWTSPRDADRPEQSRVDNPWTAPKDALQATEFHTPTQIFFRMNEVPQSVRQVFKSLAIPLPKRVLAITAHPSQPSGA